MCDSSIPIQPPLFCYQFAFVLFFFCLLFFLPPYFQRPPTFPLPWPFLLSERQKGRIVETHKRQKMMIFMNRQNYSQFLGMLDSVQQHDDLQEAHKRGEGGMKVIMKQISLQFTVDSLVFWNTSPTVRYFEVPA